MYLYFSKRALQTKVQRYLLSPIKKHKQNNNNNNNNNLSGQLVKLGLDMWPCPLRSYRRIGPLKPCSIPPS